MTETLSRWLDFAAERLGPSGPMCIISPGNDDQPFIDELLSSSTRVINPDARVIELPGGYELVSFGYSNITPWASPRELDEPELLTRIEALASQASHPDRTIFNLHVPPKETTLDQAILLQADVRFKDQCAITGNDRRQKAKPSSCPRFRRCATGLPVWGRRSAESRTFLCTWA